MFDFRHCNQLFFPLNLLLNYIGVDYGMDVSVWQGTIDWAAARSTGLNFAIARASVILLLIICF